MMILVPRWVLAALLSLVFWLPAAPALAALTGNGDGTVSDGDTGMVWDQCAWGRTWNGSTGTCDAGGTETFAWAGALAASVTANAVHHRGHDDWRLPSKNELESLVDIAATASPAIPAIFPWPYAGGEFWSSTTYLPAPANAWRVDF